MISCLSFLVERTDRGFLSPAHYPWHDAPFKAQYAPHQATATPWYCWQILSTPGSGENITSAVDVLEAAGYEVIVAARQATNAHFAAGARS